MRHPAQRRNSRAEIRSFVENPVSPISDRPSTTSSDEMVDSVEPSLEPRTSRLRRSDAFKRPRTRPKSLAPPPPPPPRERNIRKSEDCEEEAEVDGEEEVVEEGEEAGSSSRSSVARRGAEARIARLKTRVQRARLVRRATLDLYNKQITDFCARRTLFQEALVVRLVSRDDTHDDESTSSSLSEFVPAIDFVYPEEPNGTSSADLVRFFYPDYTRARKYGEYSHWKGNEEFVVGLTNEHAERRYAYCLRYLPEHKMGSLVASEDGDDAASEEDKWVTPEVLVIISPINNASFYLDLARHCVTYLQRGGHRRLHEFLSAVYCKEYPRNNGTLNVRERSSSSSLVTIRNRGAPLGRTGLAQQLHKLGPEVAMCCVAALLAEERVLVTGSSVSDVTRMVHALSALIRPLIWPYVFVPVIPDDIPSLCYNPTPYLMGILRPNLSPIRDMLTDDNDDDKHFMLVDIDLGIISPLPSRMGRASDKSWVQASAVEYAENVGMPRRYSASLLKALRGALGAGTGPEADDKVETAMLRWYASLFGHFNSAVGQANWDAEAKKRLVASCPDSHGRDYLKILVETSLFAEWVQARQSATASEYDGGDGTTRLNCFIDEHRGHRSLSQIVSKIRLVHKVKQARGSV